jgi:hypothetical protein
MVVVAEAPVDQEMIDITQDLSDQLTTLQMVAVAMVDMEYNMISLAHALGMQVVVVAVALMIILVMVKVD